MKKQVLAVITASLILAGLTACSDSTVSPISEPNISPNEQGSEISNSESLSSEEPSNASVSEFEYRRAHCFDKVVKQRGIYGETEIPDIHYENDESYFSQSGVVTHSPHGNKWEYIGLESMEFERHTVGEYTIRLVGRYVRTDKEFFPDRIFVSSLSVEVEKDGVKLSDNGYYYLPPEDQGPQYSPEKMILIDKIGSYLDLYELEYPVIAMRYYYPDEMEMDLGKIGRSVDFAVVMNGKCLSGFAGVFEPGCGLFFDNDSGKYKTNDMFTAYRGAMFKAEKFKISGENTLYDEDAGITYTFKFYDPPKPALYRAEKNVGSIAAASEEDWGGSPFTY